ncbi:MAG: hypothetical protein AAGK02_07180 [Pseudomonadota bacterium]
MAALRDLIQDALNARLTVVEIIQEPDGTIRLLTQSQDKAPKIDPLEAARAGRASKGNGHVDRN